MLFQSRILTIAKERQRSNKLGQRRAENTPCISSIAPGLQLWIGVHHKSYEGHQRIWLPHEPSGVVPPLGSQMYFLQERMSCTSLGNARAEQTLEPLRLGDVKKYVEQPKGLCLPSAFGWLNKHAQSTVKGCSGLLIGSRLADRSLSALLVDEDEIEGLDRSSMLSPLLCPSTSRLPFDS